MFLNVWLPHNQLKGIVPHFGSQEQLRLKYIFHKVIFTFNNVTDGILDQSITWIITLMSNFSPQVIYMGVCVYTPAFALNKGTVLHVVL